MKYNKLCKIRVTKWHRIDSCTRNVHLINVVNEEKVMSKRRKEALADVTATLKDAHFNTKQVNVLIQLICPELLEDEKVETEEESG